MIIKKTHIVITQCNNPKYISYCIDGKFDMEFNLTVWCSLQQPWNFYPSFITFTAISLLCAVNWSEYKLLFKFNVLHCFGNLRNISYSPMAKRGDYKIFYNNVEPWILTITDLHYGLLISILDPGDAKGI